MQHDGTVGTGGGRRVLDLAGGEHEHTHTERERRGPGERTHTRELENNTGRFFTPQRAIFSDAFSGR